MSDKLPKHEVDIAVRNHERRLNALEQRTDVPQNVYEFLRRLCACDECGVVFQDADYRGEHICHGRQGR